MNRLLFVAVILCVAGLLGLGLAVVGGPGHARAQKQDAQLLAYMNRLGQSVNCRDLDLPLPRSLDHDQPCPETFSASNTPYGEEGQNADMFRERVTYRRLSETQFAICAPFQTLGPTSPNRYLEKYLRWDGQDGCLHFEKNKSDPHWRVF